MDKESAALLSKLLETIAQDIADNSKRIDALEKVLKDRLPSGFADAYLRAMNSGTTPEKDAIFLAEIRRFAAKVDRGK